MPMSNYTGENGVPLPYGSAAGSSYAPQSLRSVYVPQDHDLKIPSKRSSVSPFCGISSTRSSDRQRRPKKLKTARLRTEYSDAFRINSGFPINFMSFSQRQYHGFRNHVEFDKKRILVSNTNQFSIHGYENCMSDASYELLNHQLSCEEEIKYVDFIEDIVPKYLFMIVNNTVKKESYLYIKLICKN